MNAIEIQEHATRMRQAYGDRAIAEAAQHARRYEDMGDKKTAETWRRIESALLLKRGPKTS